MPGARYIIAVPEAQSSSRKVLQYALRQNICNSAGCSRYDDCITDCTSSRLRQSCPRPWRVADTPVLAGLPGAWHPGNSHRPPQVARDCHYCRCRGICTALFVHDNYQQRSICVDTLITVPCSGLESHRAFSPLSPPRKVGCVLRQTSGLL